VGAVKNVASVMVALFIKKTTEKMYLIAKVHLQLTHVLDICPQTSSPDKWVTVRVRAGGWD